MLRPGLAVAEFLNLGLVEKKRLAAVAGFADEQATGHRRIIAPLSTAFRRFPHDLYPAPWAESYLTGGCWERGRDRLRPSRSRQDELLAVITENSIPKGLRHVAVFEQSGSTSGGAAFSGPLEGLVRATGGISEKKLCWEGLVERKWLYNPTGGRLITI